MRFYKNSKAFTLIELLVVISIIAVLASIALPVYTGIQIKGAQTKALSNAKQIGLAMKLFAMDNDGAYPNYHFQNGRLGTTPVSNSNTAFSYLVPDYVPSENIFAVTKSKFSPVAPDERIDRETLDSPVETLQRGECHWALVLGMSESSDPRFPLIADGFNDPSSHKYSTDETDYGGIWRGKHAIVVFADFSGRILKVDKRSLTVKMSPRGNDLFNTNEDNWMGANNDVVNPLK
jgi:prepilin-type N-terminal cleavage/methylation domain-containing protein